MKSDTIVSGKGIAPGSTVFARLPPGSDLIRGIKDACEKNGIRSGVILCCIGSLEKAVFTYAKVFRDPAVAEGSNNRLESDGPVSLLACQGVVCETEPEGVLSVHLHGSVMDNRGNVIGQDFADEGNIVFNTVDLVVMELGVRIVRAREAGLPGLITRPSVEGRSAS
jgi:hypothetical protein